MPTTIETSSGEIIQVWLKDPYKPQKTYIKRRRAEDPEFVKKTYASANESSKKRYATDETFREARKAAARKAYHKAKQKSKDQTVIDSLEATRTALETQ